MRNTVRRSRERGATLAEAPVPPVRTCVGCQERDSRPNLVRLVARGDQVVVDPTGTMPGRGAWLHPSSECLEKARRRHSFDRALRGRFQLEGVAGHLVAATQTGPYDGRDPERGLEADGHPMSTQR
ncbi:MAG: YlxR family protein [Actinobacteria bacterium]|nr:YlxR family protein [Actinomycetota bacterium]